ncbi:DUF1924 domain-containing protein [Rhodovulum sp. PH10]|uniref:DUF1924 domain-containing protein n=1 Tax=Rhodovulum sp. PH10 TaxID=1187851 RepID=UPI0012FBBDBD|nr:DUF1924 domain-containing protein [Rhodovulum sp. PH10]
MMRASSIVCAIGLAAVSLGTAVAEPSAAQKGVLDGYVTTARQEAGFSGPSAERGRKFFFAEHAGGKADSPACTSCHGKDLTKPGETRAGKAIEPMAASVTATRYTDPANVEKWFRRNCRDVLGRECTAAEKADALAFLLGL